ncbi:hypothetical protein BATDEDRAFT_27988 [Batrachochytrium dendrobatidis JAM81]|uniref:SUZ domain-containing protein n=1 Tax=Batrachochytrium dendrobatidis (strain JAM81 / FGSC 10211) TaxID=684364 RepID=F4PCY5_BATDJ|nr:uncharacterized protein BATDEDRAFT_27988 [Batrachochytrium dendrobatidis JAM81]EGF76942.1 hypothetical protein BATDEDRAFT_27988 [Batrachochytrium dendrobatidis JAM81]|eukprot:XP_006682382.1 hypothetical protein BATDEDRAFT_27988 [Batrachochytrium dendrobatidis JAM81]
MANTRSDAVTQDLSVHTEQEDEWENVESIVVPQHMRCTASTTTSSTDNWDSNADKSASFTGGFQVAIDSGSSRTEYVPQIKLLKRNPNPPAQSLTPSVVSSATAPNSAMQKPLSEREAEYNAAKIRISAQLDKEYHK